MNSHLQEASVAIGPLICKGTMDHTKLSQCEDYRKAGFPSGFYLVEKDQGLTIAFCNFTKRYETEQSDRLGDLMSSLSPYLDNYHHCLDYSVLDNATRKHSASEGVDCQDHDTENCDWKGTEGWFRIQGEAGTKLRTGKPEGECGSKTPVYLREHFVHPTSIGQLKTAEAVNIYSSRAVYVDVVK